MELQFWEKVSFACFNAANPLAEISASDWALAGTLPETARDRALFDGMALAVLVAIRDPSPEMIKAAEGMGGGTITDLWRAMVDVAIAQNISGEKN